MKVARINAATAIMFRASFFPGSRIGARPMGEVGAEMGRHPADEPYRWVVRPRSRAVGASAARVIQPAGFPLRLSGVADWSSANASSQPSPGPADRQCRPLVSPSAICRDACRIGCVTFPNPTTVGNGAAAGWFRCGVIFRRADGSWAASAEMAPASAVWR